MSAAMVFLLGTQERVRNSRGKRAIGVRATEVIAILSFRVPFLSKITGITYWKNRLYS